MPTNATRAVRPGVRRTARRMIETAGEVETKTRPLRAAGRKGAPPLAAALAHKPAPLPGERLITHEMIARLAQRLWELHGGNAVLNWLEAERMLQDLLASPTGAASAESHFHDSLKRDSSSSSRECNADIGSKGESQ